MRNKDYWEKFYKNNNPPENESDFAKFVLSYIIDNNITDKKMIDLGCGNGRDLNFFIRNNINCVGIDNAVENNEFIKNEDILKFNYDDYELIYIRFVIHSLTEEDLERLLNLISNRNKIIFIETRSSKNITNEERSETYFKSSIGEEHFRMLFSEKYLTKKILKLFNIIYKKEENNIAIYKNENPYCIRYIISTKK
jgi:SAM-dependent methyltransferase